MQKTTQTNFRDLLKLKSLEAKLSFEKKYPEAHKYFLEKGLELGKIRQHSAKLISAGALTGTLLLSPPTGIGQLPTPSEIVRDISELGTKENQKIPQQ
mgnify:FL=1